MLAACGIPKPDGFILRPRSDGLAIGAEGNAIHPTTMPFEGAQMLAACGIPQPDGAIPRPRSDGLAIGAEGNAFHI